MTLLLLIWKNTEKTAILIRMCCQCCTPMHKRWFQGRFLRLLIGATLPAGKQHWNILAQATKCQGHVTLQVEKAGFRNRSTAGRQCGRFSHLKLCKGHWQIWAHSEAITHPLHLYTPAGWTWHNSLFLGINQPTKMHINFYEAGWKGGKTL